MPATTGANLQKTPLTIDYINLTNRYYNRYISFLIKMVLTYSLPQAACVLLMRSNGWALLLVGDRDVFGGGKLISRHFFHHSNRRLKFNWRLTCLCSN
jgi:hypothetical protein